MIKLNNITKKYNTGKETCVSALDGVSVHIQKGEMTAVIGASGSGKSTLLNILGCLDEPTSGEYLLDGKNIKSYSPRQLAHIRNEVFGFVLQDFALVDQWSVYENVRIPLQYAKCSKEIQMEKIDGVLKRLGIYEKKYQTACDLSGGQRQRVAIARAVVNNPQIILADEPTGALDKSTGEDVLNILKDINKSGKTVIIVTHNMEAANSCKRIIEISDGKICSDRKI